MAQKVNLDIAQTLNITCRRGDTFALDITLKDSSGAALELVTLGYEFIMQIRTSAFEDDFNGIILSTTSGMPPNATDLTLNPLWIGLIEDMKAVDEGGTNVGNNVDNFGVVSIKISDTTMREIPSGRYVYDLQYIAAGVHTTILTGSFVVNEDVSEYGSVNQG